MRQYAFYYQVVPEPMLIAAIKYGKLKLFFWSSSNSIFYLIGEVVWEGSANQFFLIIIAAIIVHNINSKKTVRMSILIISDAKFIEK